MTSGGTPGRREASVYQDYSVVAGVRIDFKSSVKGWMQCPTDVAETLRRWNKERRLSFRNEPWAWHLATGFAAFTCKCVTCARFFNSDLSFACLFDGGWTCDDCMIAIARADEVDA